MYSPDNIGGGITPEPLYKKFGAAIGRIGDDFVEKAIVTAQEIIDKLSATKKMEIDEPTKMTIAEKLAEDFINNEERLTRLRNNLETAATAPDINMETTETIAINNQIKDFQKYMRTIKPEDLEKLINLN
jgi:hypothetical protein